MQEYTTKMLEDWTQCIMAYKGDEERIIIPEILYGLKVSVIFDDIFKGHKEITYVEFPDCVTDIGGFVFDGCENLRHVKMPKSLNYMWQYAFARSGIEEIEIPEGVRTLVSYTFQDCHQLEKVKLPQNLKAIRAWAFKNCTSLKEIQIPEATEVHPQAFLGCEDIKIIRV